MARRGERGRRVPVAAAFLAFAASAGAHGLRSPQLAESPNAAAESDETQGEVAERPLAALYAELAELRNSELRKSLDELWARSPDLALDALILRAGRETPPTLSGPRRAARETLRNEASRCLAERIAADSGERSRLRNRLELLVRKRAGGNDLACAAMLLAGDLRLYDLAPAIQSQMGSERPELRAASRAALFGLYLKWFASPEAFDVFEAQNRGRSTGELFRDAAAEYEGKARQRLVELLDLDPARAPALLDEPDPNVRAAAARAMARAMASGRLEEDAGTKNLLEHLRKEDDAGAHQAMLDAILSAVSDAAPSSALVRETRSALVSGISTGHPGEQPAIALALGRLPWALGKEPPTDSVLRGVEWLDQQLREKVLADELVDRDGIGVSLRALQTLCNAARGAGLDPSASVPGLHDVVLALVENPSELEGVRVAAASFLPAVAQPGDAERVIAVLDGAGKQTELAYAAIGALGELAKSLEPTDPGADAIQARLAKIVAGADPDLRRRALAYLLDGPLAKSVAAERPELFVEWLRAETLPDLQTKLLSCIENSGSTAELDQLLAMDSFDALVRRGPARVGEVAAVLRKLAGGDAERSMRSAERIMAVPDAPTTVRRLQVALELVAALSDEAAASLSDERQREVADWALALREKGGSVGLGEAQRAFLVRVSSVHLPKASAALPKQGIDAYARALFLADLLGLAGTDVDPEDVEDAFETALGYALDQPNELDPSRVRRSRARFYSARQQRAAALADYRDVLAAEDQAASEGRPLPPEVQLDLSELRDAAALCAKLGAEAPADARASAAESFDWTRRLVERDDWSKESVPVRMQDLHDLVERAESARDPARQLAVAELFASVPPIPPASADGDPPAPSLPPGSSAGIFTGLVSDRPRLEELHRLGERVSTLGRDLEAAAAPGSAEGAPAPSDPPTPSPDGGGATESGGSKQEATRAPGGNRKARRGA